MSPLRGRGDSERCSSEYNTFNTLGQRLPMNPKMITMKQRNSIFHTRIKSSSIQAFLRKLKIGVFLCVSTVHPYPFGELWNVSVCKKETWEVMRKTVVWNADVRGVALLRIKKTISFFKWGFLWFLIYDYLDAIFCPQIVGQSDMMYKISHVA